VTTPDSFDEQHPGSAALARLAAASGRTARTRRQLRAAEHAVANGVIEYQLARQRAGLAATDADVQLSPREREVAELVAAGRTDGEIAATLFMSKKTASVHVANIKAKLDAGSRVELAMIVAQLGLGDPGVGPTPVKRPGQRDGGPRVACPFKGLAAFDVADSELFFGRERVVAELVAKLVGSTFAALVGPSGSGKSSIARAGLLPALAAGILPGSDRWPAAVMRPGASPLTEFHRSLASALPKRPGAVDDRSDGERLDLLPPGGRLILVVDQFEEVFTLCDVAEERLDFVRALVALAADPSRRALIVLTMRSDFYGRCAEHRELADLLGESQVLVGPLNADELARAIEGPSRRAGIRVQPELVGALIADVQDQPGALPLLSATLLDLWTRMEGRTLRHADYVRIGGVRGAVARQAETAYARLAPSEQGVCRAILLRLTAVSDSGAATRRRVSTEDLGAADGPDAGRVVAVLTDARLLTVDGSFVELAHEAILDEWPRMRAWLDEDVEGRRIREHVDHAAAEWDRADRDPAELYRGARLVAALDWAAAHREELSAKSRQFLEESQAASERDLERQRRINRRLRGLLAVALLLLVVAAVAGIVAFRAAESARDQAHLAARRETEAAAARATAERAATYGRSRELAALAASTLDDDPTLSRMLAVAAADLAPPDATVTAALHDAWSADRVKDRYSLPEQEPIDALAADLHPDGTSLLVVGSPFGQRKGSLSVVNLATDAVRWTYRPTWPAASVGAALFANGGDRVVAGVYWEPGDDDAAEPPPSGALGVFVWDSRTGDLLAEHDAGPCGARLLAVAAGVALIQPQGAMDGSACRAGPRELPVRVLDLTSGEVAPYAGITSGDAVLSADGRLAAFSDTDALEYTVVDLASGRAVLALPIDAVTQDDKWIRALNADGSLLLVGDRPVTTIDVASGEVIASLTGGFGESYGVTFAPEGSLALSSGRDASLRGWDARTGQVRFVVPGAGGGQPSASSGGLVIVTDFATGTAKLIDPRAQGELGTVETCPGFVAGGSLKVVGQLAAFNSECGDGNPTTIIDLATGATRVTPGADGQALAMSADGRLLARQGSVDHIMTPLQVIDSADGRVVSEMQGLCRWDELHSGPRTEAGPCEAFPTVPFGLWNNDIFFSPDGRFLAAVDVARGEGYVAIWEVSTGRLVHAATEVPRPVMDAIFSPDSAELIVSTGDGELLALSTDEWTMERRAFLPADADGREHVDLVGFIDDDRTIVAVRGMRAAGGSWLDHVDRASFELSPGPRAHEAAPKAATLSPDGSRLVTGASDGRVRVWDSGTFELLQELRVDGQAQGVAFVGPDRLAVTPQGGNLLLMALDPDALVAVVRKGITRGFTADECDRFNFDDACPSVDELRGASR
jgi:DNA-binding CsgD family transcriptional regulator/WD40 repeat protein